MRAAVLLAWLGAVLGCRSEFQLEPTDREVNGAPRADAGTGTVVQVFEDIVLDGQRSLDPDGTIVAYRWSIVGAPPESVATITSSTAALASFRPDVFGAYEFELEVEDDAGASDRSRVQFRVLAMPLAVSAGSDISTEWRSTVQLAGMVLANPGDTPAITWTFVSKPERSTAVLLDATTMTPRFVADAEGTYVVEVAVTIPGHARTDTISITATAPRITFDGSIIDIEFTGQKFVLASDNPPRLRFLDPQTGTETSVPLSFPPTAISVQLFQPYIAVAHAGHVSLVFSATETLDDEFDVPFDVFDIVVEGFSGHLVTTQAGPIQTLDFSLRTLTPSVGPQLAGRTRVRQSPVDFGIYGVHTTGPNADLVHYSTYQLPATYLRDSPYSGEYPLGGDMWFFYPGQTRMLVRTGNIFNVTDDAATDLTYLGRLSSNEPYLIESVSESKTDIITLHNVLSSPFGSPDHQLRFYDSTTFALRESSPLPDLIVNGSPQRSIGRHAEFINQNTLYLIVSAGSTNALFTVRP